jgi:hypothetical protein
MKKIATMNLFLLMLLNIIYSLYILVLDTETLQHTFYVYLANIVFVLGFIGGVFSLILLVLSVRDKKIHPVIPVLGIVFALLLIPELFLISLQHYFERCDFPNYC